MIAVENAAIVPEITDMAPIDWAMKDATLTGFQRLRIDITPAQLWPRPKVSLIPFPEGVVGRPFNGVVFVGQIVNRKAPGDRLLFFGTRVTGDGV